MALLSTRSRDGTFASTRASELISLHLFSLAGLGWGLGAQFLGVIKY